MINMEEHFNLIENETKKAYEIAEKARARGLDPVNKVEVPVATSLAEKSVGLISVVYPQLADSGAVQRILELEKEYGQLDMAVSLKIAEEVAKQKFCKFKDELEAIDAGVRVGFAYTTLGVVSSPIEGFTGIKLNKTREGKDYIMAYFSGPIRSAGTTAGCVVLMIIDYLRELFGYAKFDPDENEVKRYVTENYDYHERVSNLQYLPTEEELTFLAKNLPIQINGEPSEEREVSNYKDLPRVETNQIRGGMCLIFSEGLAQKAQKGLRLLKGAQEKGFVATGWNFLDDYVKLHKKREKGTGDTVATYIKDIVAGRPVFSHPSRHGGFRFRYGKARTNGFSAFSLHPATMGITDNFIASGTQLKIEKPTKGGIIGVCDSIDGPIVKFKDGSVKKIMDYAEAKKAYKDVEEIIYLGDALFTFGDVANRNYELLKPGYVEEWWYLELKKKNQDIKLDKLKVSFDEALELSKKYDLPLHPEYIYYWNEINKEGFLGIVDWIAHGKIENGHMILPYFRENRERFSKGKRALELMGCEHKVTIENLVFDEKTTRALLFNLGILIGKGENVDNQALAGKIDEIIKKIPAEEKTILEIINLLSSIKIKDKLGSFIGTRMGRPEKAKLRKLTGSPHVMFPVGEEGGRLRSFQEAVETGNVNAEFPVFFCEKCNQETVYSRCEVCDNQCRKLYYCSECDDNHDEKCAEHNLGMEYRNKKIEIKRYWDSALRALNIRAEEVPLFKGVRGTSNKSHDIENLLKGILRAKYNLNVNKDGTIRYDMTEMPITHFKPKEIGTSVSKLRELGYVEDMEGKPLENDGQVLTLFPHDVLLPSCPEGDDEKADDVFFKISKFVDDELEYLYKLPRYINAKKKEDIIGQLIVCIAPHICTATVGRIIGYVHAQGMVASPFMHAAMRRDCVYPTTNFVFSDNGIIKNRKIGEYVENLIKQGNKIKKIDSFGTIKVDIDKTIYAFGIEPKTKKVVKKKIKHFIKANTPEKWIKIKTSTGREQVMTPRHKFVYLDDNNNLKVKLASEINKGDRVGILKEFKFTNNIKEIFLPRELCNSVPEDELENIRLTNADKLFKRVVGRHGKSKIISLLNIKFKRLDDWYGFVPLNHIKKLIENKIIGWEDIPQEAKIRGTFNNKEWDLNLKIDRELMSILGYYSSEGYSRQNKSVSQVCFRIMNKEIGDKLIKSIKTVFGLTASLGGDRTKISICNKLVYYLFRYCFNAGEGAYEKIVPEIVYNVSDELVKEYLSCFFDGDGTVITGKKNFVCFYSVSRQLLDGISLLGTKLGIFGRFSRTKARLPGRVVLQRYAELGKTPKKHILNHLVYSGRDFYEICKLLSPCHKGKKRKIGLVDLNKELKNRKIGFNNKFYDMGASGEIFIDIVKEVSSFEDKHNSYCFEIDWKSEEDKNVLWGEQIINARCDGDEAAAMLLLDMLLNFSRKFLPAHRGGTQDAPLVLNTRIRAGEVDDQILDLELGEYPLELYEMAEQGKHSSEMKLIDNVKIRLKKGLNPFYPMAYTHEVSDINVGPMNSSYKSLPTMEEKVKSQMELCKKIRAVDTNDVARLIIERHFIRDTRGNLRKFSMQEFRCVGCNSKFRRPPLAGKCTKCGGKLIFTIAEGSVLKYMQPALDLARKYGASPYLLENLELTEMYIQSIFGKEKEKQMTLF